METAHEIDFILAQLRKKFGRPILQLVHVKEELLPK